MPIMEKLPRREVLDSIQSSSLPVIERKALVPMEETEFLYKLSDLLTHNRRDDNYLIGLHQTILGMVVLLLGGDTEIKVSDLAPNAGAVAAELQAFFLGKGGFGENNFSQQVNYLKTIQGRIEEVVPLDKLYK